MQMRIFQATTVVTALLISIMVVTMGFVRHTRRKASSAKVGSISVSLKDLPDIGIRLIGSNDNSFESLLSTKLQGETRAAAETLSPFTFFIKNEADRAIIGYSIKWEMMGPDGVPHSHVKNYLASDVLVGRPLDGLHGVIQPGSIRLISLAPIEEINGARQGGGLRAERANAFPLAEQVEQLSARTAAFNVITISIDSVLLDDGTFAGPDTCEEFAKINARLNARRDLLRQLENDSRGNSPSRAFDRLREIANGPKLDRHSQTTPTSVFNAQQQTAAAELLGMREKLGDAETVQRALKLLNHQWLTLKRK